jgi:hypothetical protein
MDRYKEQCDLLGLARTCSAHPRRLGSRRTLNHRKNDEKPSNCKDFSLADRAEERLDNRLRHIAGKLSISVRLPSSLAWHIGASHDAN